MNDPRQDLEDHCRTQTGATLARHADTIVVGWTDGHDCAQLRQYTAAKATGTPLPTDIRLSGYAWSRDGGATWHDRARMTGDPGDRLLPAPPGGNVFGDPVVAAGADGTFYYATLIGMPACCRVGVYRSLDGGITWSGPTLVGAERPEAEMHDKPWIAVDTSSPAASAKVYVGWTAHGEAGGRPVVEVLVARSTDHGRTFQPSTKVSTNKNGIDRAGGDVQVAVGPQGQVYVVWARTTDLWFARSDDGVTFAPASPIASLRFPGYLQACTFASGIVDDRHVVNGDIRVTVAPSVAVDVGPSSPYRGRIYVAAAARLVPPPPVGVGGAVRDYDVSDVVLFASGDEGATWTNVTDMGAAARAGRVNDDTGWTDQFLPKVAVAGDGTLAVSWFDRRLSPGAVRQTDPQTNWWIDMFAAVSTDGGATFGPNFRVSDQSFEPALTNPNPNWLSGCYMGDYNGLVGGETEFLAAWGDNRDGTHPMPDLNVYVDRIQANELIP